MKTTLIVLAIVLFGANTTFADFNAHSMNQAIQSVKRIKSDIKRAAKTFGLPAEYVAGAIIAEHALNVDWRDQWQNKAIQTEWRRRLLLRSTNALLVELLESEKVRTNCTGEARAYNYWYCVIKQRYNISRSVPSTRQYKKFTNEYFNPNVAVGQKLGTTFGLGQLSPLRAMMVSDLVASRTSIPEIDFTDEQSRSQLYSDLLNPKRVVYYIAATMYQAIEIYNAYGFSNVASDMGVVITLYNIGNERRHALDRRSEGGAPQSNVMGRWAVDNIDIIRASLQ